MAVKISNENEGIDLVNENLFIHRRPDGPLFFFTIISKVFFGNNTHTVWLNGNFLWTPVLVFTFDGMISSGTMYILER
jgi:hypothetical protein